MVPAPRAPGRARRRPTPVQRLAGPVTVPAAHVFNLIEPSATAAPSHGQWRRPRPVSRCRGPAGRARGLAPRRQAGGHSRTACLARPAGRLGAGGKGEGWPVVGARPFPGWESALREEARDPSRTRLLHLGRRGGPARAGAAGRCAGRRARGAVTDEAGRGPLADCLHPSSSARGPAGSGEEGGRVAGGWRRGTAFPQGISSWQGAGSLAGTRQSLVAGS